MTTQRYDPNRRCWKRSATSAGEARGAGRRPQSSPAPVCGIALGLGAYAATASTETAGWRQGVRLAFVQHMIGRALDSVGASAEQENKVHDIVVAKFAEIAPNPEEHAALRKQALELLAAPTIDRAAVEKVRAAGGRGLRRQVQGGRRRPHRHRRPAHA